MHLKRATGTFRNHGAQELSLKFLTRLSLFVIFSPSLKTIH